MASRWLTTLACSIAAWTLAAVACPAQDFIRGDSNEDGVVTLADAHRTLRRLFFTFPDEGFCGDAADFDDDGEVSMTDVLLSLRYHVLQGGPPATPFPAHGPDTTEDTWLDREWPCTSYGGGQPLEDPEASIRILDLVVGSEREATILLAISSSKRVAGYSVEIDSGGLISPTDLTRDGIMSGIYDWSGTYAAGYTAAVTDPATGRLEIIFLSTLTGEVWIPPGESEVVLEVHVCLEPGTVPGVYPLDLTAGELVEYGSGARIDPALLDGSLTIIDELVTESCLIEASRPEPRSRLDIVFKLGDSSGSPGSIVEVPFLVTTTDQAVSRGLTFSIDFDETALELVGVTTVLPRPDAEPWPLVRHHAQNTNTSPGSGFDEGYTTGQYFYAFADVHPPLDDPLGFPTNQEFQALGLAFRIRPDAALGSAEVAFRDGAEFCVHVKNNVQDEIVCWPWHNRIISGQVELSPDLVSSFVFINGLINIVPDVTVFRRGDSNGDRQLDISDAQATLGYLFLSSTRPGCLDAADANDDGRLDISDPIDTLLHLFSGHGPLPPPSDEPGEDPTPDGITCAGIE